MESVRIQRSLYDPDLISIAHKQRERRIRLRILQRIIQQTLNRSQRGSWTSMGGCLNWCTNGTSQSQCLLIQTVPQWSSAGRATAVDRKVAGSILESVTLSLWPWGRHPNFPSGPSSTSTRRGGPVRLMTYKSNRKSRCPPLLAW